MPDTNPSVPQVALIVIGDEVLSGKVRDANSAFAIDYFQSKGIRLKRIAIISDEIPSIAATVKAFSESFDWVVTSGGVGPTHDDVTMEGVSKGLGVPVTENGTLLRLLEERRGPLSEALRRLAMVPQGTEFHWGNDRRWPVARAKNVFILPGVPSFFASCLKDAFLDISGSGFHHRSVFFNASEPDLVAYLNEIVSRFSDVTLGSYPRFDSDEYRVRITFEGLDGARLDEAVDAFLAGFPTDKVVRVER